jgi:CTP:phosphocholine cytidylyltransferase-like protein
MLTMRSFAIQTDKFEIRIIYTEYGYSENKICSVLSNLQFLLRDAYYCTGGQFYLHHTYYSLTM